MQARVTLFPLLPLWWRAADYYTFSRAGVTHFVGKGDSEFTSLEQWEREYRLFGQLHAIPFFKKYRKWKAFTVWKRGVRRDKAGTVRSPRRSSGC